MRDQQHGQMLALDPIQKLLRDASSHDCVERSERLVHQNELGLQRKHLRNCHALALSAGELTRIAIAEILEPETREPMLGIFFRLLAVVAANPQAERDVLARGPPRKERVVLE